MSSERERSRERIIAAAAELFAQFGVVNVSRHDIAKAADVNLRSVSAVGEHRSDLLREVVERLPETPVADALRKQAEDPTTSAMTTLLSAAQQALGDPTNAWEARELQALTAAPYDEPLRALVGSRVERRWAAVREVLRQLRITTGSTADEEAAVLHVLAVGVGLAVLSPLIPRAHNTRAWTALTARIIEALAADGDLEVVPPHASARVWRARVSVANSPSAIAHLTRMLSLLDVSVMSLTATVIGDDRDRALVDLILTSSDTITRTLIIDALRSVGTDVVVGRGEGSDTEDVAARVLELSTRLLAHPEYAPQAAADLLLADSWEVVDASVGEDSSAHTARLQWTVDQHVIVRRSAAPFTAGEYARASALLELLDAVTVARGTRGFGWRDSLRDGTEIVTRLARPEDTAAVEALHSRCSQESLLHRYFTPKNSWREENLRRISGGHRGMTLVVTESDASRTEDVIAIGNAFPLGPNDPSVGEIALLVEDSWHGKGIGRLLLAHLMEAAPRLGFAEVVAYVLGGNDAMSALLATPDSTPPGKWTSETANDLSSGSRAYRLQLST
ncbi:MAG: GNAT family N-acetyltransferase [Actinomycetota bacterium]|nr:GNAT family N-acetyltransferase [Actinomycetota bacterium]